MFLFYLTVTRQHFESISLWSILPWNKLVRKMSNNLRMMSNRKANVISLVWGLSKAVPQKKNTCTHTHTHTHSWSSPCQLQDQLNHFGERMSSFVVSELHLMLWSSKSTNHGHELHRAVTSTCTRCLWLPEHTLKVTLVCKSGYFPGHLLFGATCTVFI